MKCPKCNYTSFDHLDTCKKCGKDLREHKAKHNLRSLLFATSREEEEVSEEVAAGDDSFGFDFMEDQEETATTASSDDGFVLDESNADFADSADSSDDGFSFDDDDTFNFDEEEK
jgi:hypothetical protein